MHCWTCWWICLTCRCAKSQSSASVRSPANATKTKLSPEEQAQIDANQQRRNFPTGSKMETAMAQLRKINAEADSMDARTLKDSLMAVFTSLESRRRAELGAASRQTAAAIMASVGQARWHKPDCCTRFTRTTDVSGLCTR